jgi:rod shape-determining protein MreC
MTFGPDRSSGRGDTARFLICLGLSVTALFAPRAWGDHASLAIRESVLVPFLWLQERAEEGRSSRSILRAVTTERDSTAEAAQFLPALRLENNRLRALLGLSQRLHTHYVAAEVLHQALPTDGRTLVLGAGAESGVSPFDPVVAPEGLIGMVRTVDRDRSIAMTWAHPEFRASAFTDSGTVFGVAAPTAQGVGSDLLLQLRGVAYRDTIAVGSRVLTSGLGGVYPQGIPIGTVIGVAREETGWERAYLIRPNANPLIIAHVLILVTPRDSSVRRAFPPDSIP